MKQNLFPMMKLTGIDAISHLANMAGCYFFPAPMSKTRTLLGHYEGTIVPERHYRILLDTTGKNQKTA